jgi:hypothetical protein
MVFRRYALDGPWPDRHTSTCWGNNDNRTICKSSCLRTVSSRLISSRAGDYSGGKHRNMSDETPTLVQAEMECVRVDAAGRSHVGLWNARFEVRGGLKKTVRGRLGLTRLSLKPVVGKRYLMTLEEKTE